MRTPWWGLGPPSGRSGDNELELVTDDNDRYSMWDAAYVLGSLSAGERREFETHLATCQNCRQTVAELSGIPALLSQLDPAEVAATGGADAAESPTAAPDLLPSLLAAVRSQRRRTQMTTWAAAAAAAVVLGVGVFFGVQSVQNRTPATSQQSTTSADPMTQVGTNLLTSTVSVTSQHWGTFINLRCVCLAPVYAHRDTLAMIVVGRDGTATRLATWTAEPGHTATPAGSISTPVKQIAAVQVVSADSGQVLLQRSL